MANETLPIAAYREEIIKAVYENDITVIVAETGAGKSTQVPQFLLREDIGLIITEPRRLAARTLSDRTAEEYGEKLGGIIGFRTAFERQDSVRTKCLFCTDGLALVRELMGHGERDVLILDEVHEWNINLEVLLAWAKRELARGAKFKLVIMSATLDAERLTAYLGPSAKLINVPGRVFPVLECAPRHDEVASAIELLRNNRNVLIFMPGKSEIAKTIRELKESGVSAEILPLHGEMLPEEQARCFQHYGRPKCVVATNVAQTSVTIDDIDAVVDSGLERRKEVVMGVEGLYIRPISLADSAQRKGRAGRCKPGIYLDHCPEAERPPFAVAEILRSRLDQTVLRLAKAGIDAEELEFFHQPNRAEIHEAKRALRVLGCMDEGGRVTDIGNRVAELPISVQYGRMVVEAERLGVVADIVSIAALLEVGDVILRKDKDGNPTAHLWRRLVPDEHESDALAQLVLYRKAHTMSSAEMPQNGIHPKAYKKVLEVRRHLADSLRSKVKNFDSSGNRQDIIRAMCAGFLDHVYRCDGRYCHDGSGSPRQLARESVLSGTSGCVIGVPWDLEIPSKRGGTMVLNLVHIATKVDPKWLQELAPKAMT
ncbi:MAG: helicase-related protein, partial [Candidatus Margulisiibacteriota bacterium]